ncbi:hypothetical protein MN608_03646 [Microdochium nivale]|nr:hypothetical protein MN608_03646 [Microdochium nivale]
MPQNIYLYEKVGVPPRCPAQWPPSGNPTAKGFDLRDEKRRSGWLSTLGNLNVIIIDIIIRGHCSLWGEYLSVELNMGVGLASTGLFCSATLVCHVPTLDTYFVYSKLHYI